jgi:DNA invertase Pin-like site-specific DNA recombinase
VSSDEQAEGCSLNEQERQLRSYCANRGYNVIDVYHEDYSAKYFDMKRPEMKKIYDYCRKHRGMVDKVLFVRWDRFSRNVEFAFAYKRKFYDE